MLSGCLTPSSGSRSFGHSDIPQELLPSGPPLSYIADMGNLWDTALMGMTNTRDRNFKDTQRILESSGWRIASVIPSGGMYAVRALPI